ncbi:hypothetical protein CB1_000880023 [Camelus ferus]|nr:hypothetical protein CB1_000880023 [Camelus ferus]
MQSQPWVLVTVRSASYSKEGTQHTSVQPADLRLSAQKTATVCLARSDEVRPGNSSNKISDEDQEARRRVSTPRPVAWARAAQITGGGPLTHTPERVKGEGPAPPGVTDGLGKGVTDTSSPGRAKGKVNVKMYFSDWESGKCPEGGHSPTVTTATTATSPFTACARVRGSGPESRVYLAHTPSSVPPPGCGPHSLVLLVPTPILYCLSIQGGASLGAEVGKAVG